jgi:hypothetical protein
MRGGVAAGGAFAATREAADCFRGHLGSCRLLRAPMLKRSMIWALAIILTLGGLPLVSMLLALGFADAFDCGINEGSVQPCIVFGHDFGGLLYPMALSGWFAMFTIPLAGLALIVWLIVLIVLFFFFKHRRRRAGGVVE